MISHLMSDTGISSKIIIAKWTDRFFAWVIDFIIVSIISTSIIFTSFGTIDYEFEEDDFLEDDGELSTKLATRSDSIH